MNTPVALAIQGGIVGQRCVGQIEGFRALLRAEQGGIALCSSLYDLVFHREQIRLILSRLGIGVEDNTFLLECHLCMACHALFFYSQRVGGIDHVIGGHMDSVQRRIIRIVYEMSGVVALQLQY